MFPDYGHSKYNQCIGLELLSKYGTFLSNLF